MQERRPRKTQDVPLKIVGGTHFGRYPKISIEKTYNMIVSDNALVDYAGYKNILQLSANGEGRGIYTSHRADIIIAVVGDSIFKVSQVFGVTFLTSMSTSQGDVFISENNGGQIAITDGVNIYVYNYNTNLTTIVTGTSLSTTFGFTVSPGHISFQNGRLILSCTGTTNWILSGFNDATSWTLSSQTVGSLQSKPDTVQAAIPFPGRGNLLFLFGNTVVEAYTDVGGALFPYLRNNSFNIDYGCLNASSIAALGEHIVWLGANEQSGPVIMRSNGNAIEEISTDGLDFQFSQLTNPFDCSGFLVKLDGHLIYQFTFKTDNLSYLYDFDTETFFNVTDEKLDYHIAKNVVYFNNDYFFVSFNDGNLYQFGTQFTNYQYSDTDIRQIPRIRITPPIRLPSARYFIIDELEFTIENGEPNQTGEVFHYHGDQLYLGSEDMLFIIGDEAGNPIAPTQLALNSPVAFDLASEAVDLAISRDGGVNFGNQLRRNMNPTGVRRSLFNYLRLGIANDTSYMLQFWGYGRFVAFDGVIWVRQ